MSGGGLEFWELPARFMRRDLEEVEMAAVEVLVEQVLRVSKGKTDLKAFIERWSFFSACSIDITPTKALHSSFEVLHFLQGTAAVDRCDGLRDSHGSQHVDLREVPTCQSCHPQSRISDRNTLLTHRAE